MACISMRPYRQSGIVATVTVPFQAYIDVVNKRTPQDDQGVQTSTAIRSAMSLAFLLWLSQNLETGTTAG